jgi:hypothetical protein
MNISRRRFIQGAAALPLATVPALAFASAAEPLPTAEDIMYKGADAGRPAAFTDDRAKPVLVECAKKIKVLEDDGSDAHWMSNNVMEWTVAHCEVELNILAGIALLSTYQLHIGPDEMPVFDSYVKKTQAFIFPKHLSSAAKMSMTSQNLIWMPYAKRLLALLTH